MILRNQEKVVLPVRISFFTYIIYVFLSLVNINNMVDILNAIINIINHPIPDILNHYKAISKNRINSVGDALEEFVKDAFANTIAESDLSIKVKKHSQTFSWLGNQNNPPDLIIRHGDAIEVKKITSLTSQIALNSSYPKDKISSSDSMITSDCKKCENWSEKDVIYTIGIFRKDQIRLLWMIYGSCYAAKSEYYTRIKNKVSIGIDEIEGVEFSETKELGRVNKVDPLGITYLRIRGMWVIGNPIKAYEYLDFGIQDNDGFQLIAIIPEEKYLFLSDSNKKVIESLSNCNMSKEKIKSPNNPAKMIDARILNYIKK